MEKVTIRDRMLMCAESGETSIKLNLYKKQVRALIEDGYTIQRLGSVPNYPDQGAYQIDWKNAIDGTTAYELLKKAAAVNPKLLQKENESGSPLPPPYTNGGGWANI